MINILQNVLVLLFVYFPPLALFVWGLRKRKVNIFILTIICIVYSSVTLFTGTQNLVPFIFVLLNIRLIRTSEENRGVFSNNSYLDFGFNIREFKIVNALKYSGISYAITFGVSLILMVFLLIFKVNLEQQKIVTELINSSLYKILIMAPMMIVFAPVLEEFIFRWFLFEKVISKRIGIIGGAVISSLIFACIHFNIRSFLVIFTLGLINCYLIEKKGYWYAVFNHSVFNSVSVIAMIIQKIMG